MTSQEVSIMQAKNYYMHHWQASSSTSLALRSHVNTPPRSCVIPGKADSSSPDLRYDLLPFFVFILREATSPKSSSSSTRIHGNSFVKETSKLKSCFHPQARHHLLHRHRLAS